MRSPNPILVEVTRGSLVESFHRGAVVVADSFGETLFEAGDIRMRAYMRSSAKPFQALPLVTSGAVGRFQFTPREIALMCGSHNGEEAHIETVSGILRKAGLREDKLKCGPHPPFDPDARLALKKSGASPSQLHNNCSGKHTAMLAGCVHENYSLEGYLEFDHPWQKKILEAIAELAETGTDEIVLGVDGCGAPVHALPLYNSALAGAKLAGLKEGDGPPGAACGRIFRAMTENPYMVAGKDRICTELIEAGGGKLLAKAGAEGYYLAAFRDNDRGIGIAVKIDDGAERARDIVVIELLHRWGALEADGLRKLEKRNQREIFNHSRQKVGEIKTAF